LTLATAADAQDVLFTAVKNTKNVDYYSILETTFALARDAQTTKRFKMRLEDIPTDIRDAAEIAGWAAADAFLATLEQRLPMCDLGGFRSEIGPLLSGILRNLRGSLAGGAIRQREGDSHV
jgi:hypothetical protein